MHAHSEHFISRTSSHRTVQHLTTNNLCFNNCWYFSPIPLLVQCHLHLIWCVVPLNQPYTLLILLLPISLNLCPFPLLRSHQELAQVWSLVTFCSLLVLWWWFISSPIQHLIWRTTLLLKLHKLAFCLSYTYILVKLSLHNYGA